MRQVFLGLVGLVALATSTGCCCMDRLWCHQWGCCPWGGCDKGGCDAGGCDSCGGAEGGCESCGGGMAHKGLHDGHGLIGHHKGGNQDAYGGPAGPPGPPTGAVAYPYYTNRGPRDYFAKNPPSIGP